MLFKKLLKEINNTNNMKDTIIKVLHDLIKIPSISTDIKKLEEVISYIENYYKDIN
jgi:acetylornithine deacetylase/succinyl-diaminopimelate desuccinylase-like protein